MLDISKPLTAGKATNYFKQEYANADNSYYTQGQSLHGKWHGKFAEELGLTCAVTEEQFARLAQGHNPNNREQWWIGLWRRRRDSNPRYGLSPYNGLANRRLQPLGHVSGASLCRALTAHGSTGDHLVQIKT